MNSINDLANALKVPEASITLFSALLIVLVIVVLLLKGLALWRSARNGQRVWFWVLLFVNTVGILEIIYLFTNKEKK